MSNETLVRRTLAFSVLYNLGGAVIFFFPGSIGKLIGLPQPAYFAYTGFGAAVILLFAGVYYWQVKQPELNKPLMEVAAIGKASFFLVMLISWLIGESSVFGTLIAVVDLAMAAIFAQLVLSSGKNSQPVRQDAAASPRRSSQLVEATRWGRSLCFIPEDLTSAARKLPFNAPSCST